MSTGSDAPRGTVLVSSNLAWNLVNFRTPVIRSLLADGYRVAAAAPYDAQWVAQLEAMGCSFHPLAIDSKGVSPMRDAALFRQYVALMRRLRPVAYLGWTIKPNVYGAMAAARHGVPAFPNVSGLGTAFISRGLLTWIAILLYRIGFARASTVFFQNADDAGLFVDGKMVRAAQVQLLPGSGIDVTAFAPPGEGRPARRRFLMVSRTLADKGAREFVAAARMLRAEDPALEFAILGATDAPNRTAIPPDEIAAWRTEGAVALLPPVADVRPFIGDSDCVVLPSYREGTARVLLEGAAMARPLVATDVPGCREVVEDGRTGFLCPVRDAEGLAMAMRRVAALDDDAWRAMGQAGRAKVAVEFSEAAVVASYRAALARAGVA